MTDATRPPVGCDPAWLRAVSRISELAGAIQRYAEDGSGTARKEIIRTWAEEIIMQLDIWDWITKKNEWKVRVESLSGGSK